jgi:CRISPR-associated endonuclease/helicase Cas3
MFERVGVFLEGGAGKKNLMLQHGKAALNKQFEKLRFAATVYDEDEHPSAVVAEGWFAANKKHRFLAPYGVGTIDQALLAVLQTKHVFVRLFGLAGKCVILDEVHAYDAYMTTLMERLLRWLAAIGCPVVLLSATLPQQKRLKLLRAYSGEELPEPESVTYPRVTYVSQSGRVEVRHIEADARRARTVGLGWLDEGRLAIRCATRLRRADARQ